MYSLQGGETLVGCKINVTSGLPNQIKSKEGFVSQTPFDSPEQVYLNKNPAGKSH